MNQIKQKESTYIEAKDLALRNLANRSTSVLTEHDKPNIFMKKKSMKEIKPLEYVNNDTGKTRHYPPAAQE